MGPGTATEGQGRPQALHVATSARSAGPAQAGATAWRPELGCPMGQMGKGGSQWRQEE